jgi:hypothetical protein
VKPSLSRTGQKQLFNHVNLAPILDLAPPFLKQKPKL